MKNALRFSIILLVIIAALMLTLVVAGVFSTDEFLTNFTKAAELVGIGLVASAIILLVSKK